MKTNTLLLLLAWVLAAFGALVAYIGTVRGRIGLFWIVVVAFSASAACVVARRRLSRGAVDWERIEAEQRLWESGPLGKAWLRLRSRVVDRLR